jgi:thiol-disulfide isomerase/thioredoxin
MNRGHVAWMLAVVGVAGCAARSARGTAAGQALPPNPGCQELDPQPIDRPGVRRGQEAPDFEATDMAGKRWSLQALRGRPVLLNFWATWCAPCRVELPALEVLARRADSRLAVLTVNVDEDRAAVSRFLQEGSALTVLLDPEKEISRRFGVSAFPETFLIDSQGRVQQLFFKTRWDGPAAAHCLAAAR